MDNRVVALEDLTQAMLKRLQEADFEEIAGFVRQREQITDVIIQSFRQSPPTADEQEKLRELLAYDQQLTQHMNALKFEASQWLINRNQAKMQRSAYETAYAPDSFLMDRKK
ncbi:hypothetical protein [Paenibacillus sp. sgz500958]|uniref:hypothetical protein n=1 Tax=Paenibacillus sp. sgz500958 TaxID=3242475 RepID=UPI0036D35E8E